MSSDHARADGDQRARGGPADAAGGARHHRDFCRQVAAGGRHEHVPQEDRLTATLKVRAIGQ
jgi:hypothetical protein